jgi:hypothetical protein
MRFHSIAAIAAITLGITLSGPASASAQSDESSYHKKVFGYQDPQTGAFHPLEQFVPEVTPTATTGTIELTIVINLKTPLPKGGSIICNSDVSVSSINLSTDQVTSWGETASTVAAASGASHTCTVNIPYSWTIPASSSVIQNQLTGEYLVEMTDAAGVLPGIVRTSSSQFVSLKKIPSTGTISKYTVDVTL